VRISLLRQPYKLDADELDASMAAIRRCQWGPRRRQRLRKQGQQEEAIETGRPHRPVGQSSPAQPPGYGERSPSRSPVRDQPGITRRQTRHPTTASQHCRIVAAEELDSADSLELMSSLCAIHRSGPETDRATFQPIAEPNSTRTLA